VLLSVDPLYLGAWVEALRPVRQWLNLPLAKVFRGEDKTLSQYRQVAASVLADYAADQPDELAELLLAADPKQYAVLFPVLQAHRERATQRMRAELARVPDDWKDAPLNPSWKGVPEEIRREVEGAGGMVAQRWALCQALPAARVQAVTEGLRASGYRPTRVRPYASGQEVRQAVVWARDGRAWRLESDLKVEAARARDREQQKAGYVPVDIAGVLQGEGERYTVLWVKARKGEEDRLYAGVPATKHKAETDVLKEEKFIPLTVQGVTGPDGTVRFAGVWGKVAGQPADGSLTWDRDEREHAGLVIDRVRRWC
jgi:Polyglycine hydrolase-like, structural repeat